NYFDWLLRDNLTDTLEGQVWIPQDAALLLQPSTALQPEGPVALIPRNGDSRVGFNGDAGTLFREETGYINAGVMLWRRSPDSFKVGGGPYRRADQHMCGLERRSGGLGKEAALGYSCVGVSIIACSFPFPIVSRMDNDSIAGCPLPSQCLVSPCPFLARTVLPGVVQRAEGQLPPAQPRVGACQPQHGGTSARVEGEGDRGAVSGAHRAPRRHVWGGVAEEARHEVVFQVLEEALGGLQ
ncbi:unnamed protein product, partial [Closterium sp. Naga37s-1]